MQTEHPGNRPAGIPGNARFAATGLVFAIILIAVDLIAVIAGEDADRYFALAQVIFVPLIIVAFVLLVLLNLGRLIFVRLFRWAAMAVTIVYVGAIAWDAGMIMLNPTGDVASPLIAGGMLLLFSPLLVLMWRDLLRSRWLDPRSSPHEWEFAAMRDPKSINYRGPR